MARPLGVVTMDPEQIKEWIAQYGYWAVVIGTFWDSSGLQLFVIGGGAAAGITGELTYIGVVLAGVAGNLGTDLIFYGVGRWHANWLDRVVRSEKNRARLALMGDEMHRYAWPLLIFGRFMPWIGRFIPAAAGIRCVPSRRVLPAIVAGGFVASAAYALVGYAAGAAIEAMEGYSLWVVWAAINQSFFFVRDKPRLPFIRF